MALRWEDVDLELAADRSPRRLRRCRGPHQESPGQGVPALADPAAELSRICGPRRLHLPRRLRVLLAPGRRLDRAAVRRRFKAARDAAGLRALRFHALRHAAGSL